jgi:hypothetical protein
VESGRETLDEIDSRMAAAAQATEDKIRRIEILSGILDELEVGDSLS